MIADYCIDKPLGDVDLLIAELPWPMLLVGRSGQIWAANDPAEQLLGRRAAQSYLKEYLSEAEAERVSQQLALIQSVTSTTTFSFHIAGVEHSLRGYATPLNDVLLALAFTTSASPVPALATLLSQAAALCFAADDISSFCKALQAPLTEHLIGTSIVLYDRYRQQLDWSFVADDKHVRELIRRNIEPKLIDVVHGIKRDAQAFVLPLDTVGLGIHSTTRLLDQAWLNMIWGRSVIVLPLTTESQVLGFMIVFGVGQPAGYIQELQPFGRLLGIALERVQQQKEVLGSGIHAIRLLEASQAISRVTELEDVLRTICEQTIELSGATTAAVWTPDHDSDFLRCVMAVGAFSDRLLGYRSAIATSVIGQIYGAQQVLLVPDVQQWIGLEGAFKEAFPVSSANFLVLHSQGRRVGVLMIGFENSHYLGVSQLELLEQFSANAAVAIENAGLHASIRRSEERYRTLFQNALEIVLTLDPEGRIVAWNRAALQFLGVSPVELSTGALNIRDLVSLNGEWITSLATSISIGIPPAPTELELQRPDGSTAIVEVTVQLLREDGKAIGMYLIGRDMTERHQQQHALKAQVMQLTALHQLGIALNSSLDRTIILQQAVAAIAHTHHFDMVGVYLPDAHRTHLELVAAVGVSDEMHSVIERALPGSFLYAVWQDGRIRTAVTNELAPRLQPLFEAVGVADHVFLPLLTNSRVRGVLSIGCSRSGQLGDSQIRVLQTMTTQIAQALENIDLYAEVELNATRYRDLYENANDFIGTMTTDGKILSLNRAALSFFGYSLANLEHLTLHDLLPDAVSTAAQTLRRLRQGELPAKAHELQVKRHDGSYATLEIRSRLVLEGDAPTAVHFIARDITERRQLESQVRQGEKLAALGQLVAGAAHELNNPLAVVLGTTQLLRREPHIGPFAEDIHNIEVAAQRAKHIVKQMLTFAREQTDMRMPVDLALVIDRVLQSLSGSLRYNKIEVQTNLPPQLPPLWGDTYQVEQILDNLLHNAIHVLIDHPQPRMIKIDATASATMVQFSVTDNGPGIAPHIMPRIFDPFFTTKEVGRGTGLGLSLVYGIVQKHGGTINAASVLGQGATFLVELPIAHSTVDQPEMNSATESKNGTILVVEDEVDVRLIVGRALQQHGYVVDAVDSAEEALRQLSCKRYDLVITDLRMPDISGNELYERARLIHPRVRWVFMTGDTMSASSEAFLLQHGVPYLAKPFTLEELWDTVALSIVPQRKP